MLAYSFPARMMVAVLFPFFLFNLEVHYEELLMMNETDVIMNFTADSIILLLCYFAFCL